MILESALRIFGRKPLITAEPPQDPPDSELLALDRKNAVFFRENAERALDRLRGFLMWPYDEGGQQRFEKLLAQGIETTKARYKISNLKKIFLPHDTNPNEEVRAGDLLCIRVENFSQDPTLPQAIFVQKAVFEATKTNLAQSISILTQDGSRVTFNQDDYSALNNTSQNRQALPILNAALADLTLGIDTFFAEGQKRSVQ